MLSYTFLERPWVLFGVIIGLSSGYAIALIVGLVFGCIKCLKFTELKISQWRENKRENTEPDPMHLRVMQQRVQQLQRNLQQQQV